MFAIQYIIGFYNCNLSFVVISVIIKTFWNLIVLGKDIKNCYIKIDQLKQKPVEILKQFRECIQLHSDAKQLSKIQEYFFNHNSTAHLNGIFLGFYMVF